MTDWRENMVDLEQLKQRYDAGEQLKYLFFWGHRPAADGSITQSCLSQWFACRFTVDGVEYHTAEQYMMAQKALLFDDQEVYQKILAANHPHQYKALGRQVRGFDEPQWERACVPIVVRGNLAKFSQNEPLGAFLRGTGKRILVEASPTDCIWGIGRSKDAEQIENPHTWRGSNRLGFALMEVREQLQVR